MGLAQWMVTWLTLCALVFFVLTCLRIWTALDRVAEIASSLRVISDWYRAPKTVTLSPDVMDGLRGRQR